METWDAIRTRRNVRVYTEQPIAAPDLDRILEAGRRSPSSQNSQPWDFVVVTEREQLQELSKVWSHAQHVAISAATVAPVARVRGEDWQRLAVQYDLGQATMSMMLVAADLGIGSAHSAVADQDLARKLLGYPEDRFCAYLIAFGYPADRPLRPIRNPNRRPFDEVVHRGRW
ncbi:MAG TPA: nitroreductase family protein [Actinomycetota bacterium]|nr:nitroreductase family protein [Actinomycetota bacterium]